MDKALIARCFAQARSTYEREARVQQQVARHMADMLRTLRPRLVVELGCGTGNLSRLLLEQLHPQELWLNDLCPEMADCLTDLLGHTAQDTHVTFHPGDAETMDLPPEAGLIVSCSTLQWFTALPDFFSRCHASLLPGGTLAFSTFGGDNLKEIRAITGHGLDYPGMEELKLWLARAGFHVTHASDEVHVMTFAHPTDVLRHLKQTGVTGTEKRMWTRSRLQAFCDTYRERFGTRQGGVELTYHVRYMVGRKNMEK